MATKEQKDIAMKKARVDGREQFGYVDIDVDWDSIAPTSVYLSVNDMDETGVKVDAKMSIPSDMLTSVINDLLYAGDKRLNYHLSRIREEYVEEYARQHWKEYL